MKEPPSDRDEIARIAVDCGFHIHKDLGPGPRESVYEAILAAQLTRRGLSVERQKPLGFTDDGLEFSEGFRVDLLIEGQFPIELRSVEVLAPVHSKQLLTYLRLLGQPLGLLMNFGAGTFREGTRRVANSRGPLATWRLGVTQDRAAEGAPGPRPRPT